MSVTVITGSHICRRVLDNTAEEGSQREANQDRGDDSGDKDRRPSSQGLECPYRVIRLPVVERNRNGPVQARPLNFLLAEGGNPKGGPRDHRQRDRDPRQPALPIRNNGRGAAALHRMRNPEFRIVGRAPNLEEQHSGDERAERGQNVGQRIVDVVGSHELRQGETAAGDEQDGPECADGAPAAIECNDIEGEDEGDEWQLPTNHRAERRRGKPGHRAKNCHGHAQSTERDRRGVEDQDKHQRFKRREANEDQKRACDGNGCAEARNAFEQRAEAKPHDHKNDTAVIRQIAGDPIAERVEAARAHRDIVEQQRIEHDPHHRPQRKNRAVRD